MKNFTSLKGKLTFTTIMVALLLPGMAKAQENQTDKTSKPEPQVVINKEMIERFNQCDTGDKLISWSDLVLGFDSENLMNLFLAYQNADLGTQTLEEIKLALETKQTEHLNNSNIDNDLAWFNQVKQEISNKLRTTDMVARK